MSTESRTVEMIPVDQIAPATDNVRGDVGDVTDLAATIRSVGVLQPLIVTPDEAGGYLLVVGHRRYAAAKTAGLDTVPCEIRKMTDVERVEAMTVENLQREDLSALEEARAYQQLRDLGLSQRQLAKRVGRSQGHISKRLTLLQLTDAAQQALDSGGITIAHAIELVRLADHPEALDEALADIQQTPDWPAEHAVNRRLRNVEREQRFADAEARIQAEGLTAVDYGAAHRYTGEPTEGPRVIGAGWGEVDVDPEAHRSEPCHAVAINHDADLVAVCTTPARHQPAAEHAGDTPEDDAETITDVEPTAGASPLRVTQPEETDAERAARVEREAAHAEYERLTAEREAAHEARIEAMRGLVAGKVSRTKAVDFILRQLVVVATYDGGEVMACDLLGIEPANSYDDPPAIEDYAERNRDSLLRAALAVALQTGEQWIGSRGPHPDSLRNLEARRHYDYLIANGYEPTEVEQTALVEADQLAAQEAAFAEADQEAEGQGGDDNSDT